MSLILAIRCRELEDDLREEQRIHGQDAEAARRARTALLSCEEVLATTQAERDQALAKGAEEERQRLHSRLRKLALRYGDPTRYELLEVARSLTEEAEEGDVSDLTEKLARELWRLNRRFNDTVPEWEDAEPEHRAQTEEQAEAFINAARRQGAEEERERLRDRLMQWLNARESSALVQSETASRDGTLRWITKGRAEAYEDARAALADILAALDTPAPSESEEGK